MKKSFAPFILGLGLLEAASAAQADKDWYAAVDVGNSWIGVYSSTYGDTTDHGYRLSGGYGFSRYLTLEASYVDFGKVSTRSCISLVCPVGATTEIKAHAFSLDGLGHLPLGESWSLFIRAGANRGHLETDYVYGSVSADTTSFDAGFGADYRFSEAWKLRMQFVQYQNLGSSGPAGTAPATSA